MLARWATRLALVAVVLVGGAALHLRVAERDAAQAAVLRQGVGNFDGPWYVGGNLMAPALIVQAGTALTLMNEQGRVATATANISQVNSMWDTGPVVGALSPDQRQINWSNGTIWQRRAMIDAARLGGPNIGGIWYSGDNAERVLIVQPADGSTLQLLNEQGRTSPAIFVAPETIAAIEWEGGVRGRLSPDGNMINWTNGTNWRR